MKKVVRNDGYINNPIGLSYITKICYYNKKAKDHLSKPCYRLELTCTTKGKIGELFIPYDEVMMVLNYCEIQY